MACSCVFAGIVVMVLLCDSIISLTYSSPWFKSDKGVDYSLAKACQSDKTNSWCVAMDWQIHAKSFKVAAVLCGLASTALFVALCASCGICCNCCRNRVPTIMIMVCAITASVLLLIAGIAFAAMKKNSEDTFGTGKFSYGFAMVFVASLLLLLIPALAYMFIRKQGDIVQYTPRVAMIVPSHSYPGYSTYPGYGGNPGYNGQPGYGQPAYGGQPGPAWGAPPQQGTKPYQETSYPA